jgi:hypothetical protein
MEKKERDLGFFNGIKTEAIPLIAGLISFTLLIETGANNIGSFFNIDETQSTITFVIVYFIVPILGLILWLTLVNYNDGLKKRIWDNRKSLYSWPFLVLLFLLLLLCVLFIARGVLYFNIIALLFLILVIGLAFALLHRYRVKATKYRRERYQANFQFALVFILLTTFWTIYLSFNFLLPTEESMKGEKNNTLVKQDSLNEKAMNQNLFDTIFREAITIRGKSDTLNSDVNSFTTNFQEHIYNLCPYDSVEENRLDSCFNKIVQAKSNNCLQRDSRFRKNPKDTTPDFYSFMNAELIKYQLDKRLKEQDQEYRLYWSAWLRTVQYRGLVLFILTVLFLLTIWYYAYNIWLESQENNNQAEQNISEIYISKISIYVIFLLVIPFLKPITSENTSFAKPYMTFSNPLTLLVEKNGLRIENKLENRIESPQQLNIDLLVALIRDTLERPQGKIEVIRKQTDNVTKKP